MGKVFAQILLKRLSPLFAAFRRPEQSGFTSGRSTTDAILALRIFDELHREFNRPMYVGYIDIKAAFDSVDRLTIRSTLGSMGVPVILLDLIMDLYTNTTVRARIGSNLSDPSLLPPGSGRAVSLPCSILLSNGQDFN